MCLALQSAHIRDNCHRTSHRFKINYMANALARSLYDTFTTLSLHIALHNIKASVQSVARQQGDERLCVKPFLSNRKS